MLDELCMKRQSGLPYYDLVTDSTTDKPLKVFGCTVYVLGHKAKGQGMSEADAKLEAAKSILNIMQERDLYRADVQAVRPRFTNIGEAIGQLIDICFDRRLPFATYEARKLPQIPHGPFFECQCRIASLVTVGGASIKNVAKKIAALEMLNEVWRMDDKQIAAIGDVITPRIDIERPLGIMVRNRLEFFQKLKPDVKANIGQIFMATNETARARILLLCRALRAEYKHDEVSGNHFGKIMYFEIIAANFNIAIAALEPDLYDEVLEYVSNMWDIPYLRSQ